jgi:holin-like protein
LKFIIQFSIILFLSFIGELLSSFIPLPIPGSIYGLIILLILLCTKVIKLHHVKEVSDFLIEIMPLMFIPVTVGIMDSYKVFTHLLPEIIIAATIVTAVVMGVSGVVTQFVIRRTDSKRRKRR